MKKLPLVLLQYHNEVKCLHLSPSFFFFHFHLGLYFGYTDSDSGNALSGNAGLSLPLSSHFYQQIEQETLLPSSHYTFHAVVFILTFCHDAVLSSLRAERG